MQQDLSVVGDMYRLVVTLQGAVVQHGLGALDYREGMQRHVYSVTVYTIPFPEQPLPLPEVGIDLQKLPHKCPFAYRSIQIQKMARPSFQIVGQGNKNRDTRDKVPASH